MTKTAIVIGGTGPTGPRVLTGLIERGFDVTIFHRGTHEPPDLPPVRHIHGDPHFAESIRDSVGQDEYDLVVAAYGRTKLLADAFRGRAGHFVAVGGSPRYAGFYRANASLAATDPPLPIREDAPKVGTPPSTASASVRFGSRMVETEDAVFASHPSATFLIYPVVYGPRNVIPWEWSVVRRVLDGRRQMILPDDGMAVHSRGAAANMAHSLLLSVDQPALAAGTVYNCGDDHQLSLRQWIQAILDALGADMQMVGVPSAVAPHFKAVYIPHSASIADHTLLDTSRIRAELGYRDLVSPADALAESVKWYLQHPVTSREIPAFEDRFDYQLEDGLIAAWTDCRARILAAFPQPLQDEVHPMPHPKQAGLLADERAR